LAGLFRDDDVDTRLGNYLASILEKNADKKILGQIAADHVKKAIKRIDDINNSKNVMLTVGALWGPIQLRAVTEVLKMGMVNSRNDRILYKEWFNGCIVPALRVSHYNEAKTFTRQDVQALYDICHANTWSNLSTEEAIQLLGLFKTIGLHSLEVAYTKLGDRDEKTWIKILTEIYGFSLEISQICYANKTTMIT